MLFNEYKPKRVSQFGKVQIIIWKKIIAVIDATFAAAKKGPEKIQIFFHTILHPADPHIWFSYIHNFKEPVVKTINKQS